MSVRYLGKAVPTAHIVPHTSASQQPPLNISVIEEPLVGISQSFSGAANNASLCNACCSCYFAVTLLQLASRPCETQTGSAGGIPALNRSPIAAQPRRHTRVKLSSQGPTFYSSEILSECLTGYSSMVNAFLGSRVFTLDGDGCLLWIMH